MITGVQPTSEPYSRLEQALNVTSTLDSVGREFGKNIKVDGILRQNGA
jgi:hypothetical protein